MLFIDEAPDPNISTFRPLDQHVSYIYFKLDQHVSHIDFKAFLNINNF